MRNWLFGYYIVEFEGGGAERTELYGKKLIDRLASSLAERGMKGISAANLRKCRAFYEAYPEIRPTLSVESSNQSPEGARKIQQTASVESRTTLTPVQNNSQGF